MMPRLQKTTNGLVLLDLLLVVLLLLVELTVMASSLEDSELKI